MFFGVDYEVVIDVFPACDEGLLTNVDFAELC